MKCPICGEEGAEILFHSVECINVSCQNYSEKLLNSLQEEFVPITDEEVDELFEEVDLDIPFGD